MEISSLLLLLMAIIGFISGQEVQHAKDASSGINENGKEQTNVGGAPTDPVYLNRRGLRMIQRLPQYSNGLNVRKPRLRDRIWQYRRPVVGLPYGRLVLPGLPGNMLVNSALSGLYRPNAHLQPPVIHEAKEDTSALLHIKKVQSRRDLMLNLEVPKPQPSCLKREWGPSCSKVPPAFFINMDSVKRTRIVDLHNANRRLLASGSVPGYAPTAKMAPLEWNPKLAFLAETNVMQCKMQKEECVHKELNSSGQNLALSTYEESSVAPSDDELINTSLESWWKEIIAGHIRTSSGYLSRDHVQAMVQEDNASVGCAASKFLQDGKVNFLMACYYAYANTNGQYETLS